MIKPRFSFQSGDLLALKGLHADVNYNAGPVRSADLTIGHHGLLKKNVQPHLELLFKNSKNAGPNQISCLD